MCDETNFHKHKHGKHGFTSVCKACCKKQRKAYTSTAEYKEKHRIQMKKWRKENPDKALEISRRSYKRNGAKQNERKREKYRTDPEYRAKCIERDRRYSESGRRYEMNNKPEQREKARARTKRRRKNEDKRAHDLVISKKWRDKNREHLITLHRERRQNLAPSYVAQSMRISVGDLTPEILETKRNVIKLKRELKNNNVKIR